MSHMQGAADRRRWCVDTEHLPAVLASIELVDAFAFPYVVPFGLKTFDSWFVRNLRHDVNGIWSIPIPQDFSVRSIEFDLKSLR